MKPQPQPKQTQPVCHYCGNCPCTCDRPKTDNQQYMAGYLYGGFKDYPEVRFND